jgi:hypothetical protein
MNARTAAKRPEIPVTAPNVMAGAKSKWTMRQYLVPTRSLDNSHSAERKPHSPHFQCIPPLRVAEARYHPVPLLF